MAALAAVAGLIDILRGARIRSLKAASWHAGGNLLAVLIELYNWYARSSAGSNIALLSGMILLGSSSRLTLRAGRRAWSAIR